MDMWLRIHADIKVNGTSRKSMTKLFVPAFVLALSDIESFCLLGALLLTWINLNPSMDK